MTISGVEGCPSSPPSLLSAEPPLTLGWAQQGEMPNQGLEGLGGWWAPAMVGFVKGTGSWTEADGREMLSGNGGRWGCLWLTQLPGMNLLFSGEYL